MRRLAGPFWWRFFTLFAIFCCFNLLGRHAGPNRAIGFPFAFAVWNPEEGFDLSIDGWLYALLADAACALAAAAILARVLIQSAARRASRRLTRGPAPKDGEG